jgi:hypothetical protein
MPEPMSDERLAEAEEYHAACSPTTYGGCQYSLTRPCDVTDLLAEVRRLKRALQLSEASRGKPMSAMDRHAVTKLVRQD